MTYFTTCTLGDWTWKTKELLFYSLFTYFTTLSRCDTYIPRRCHTKILKNRCLNTFNQKWNHLCIEVTNGFGKVWIVRCKRKNSTMHCNGTNSKSSSFSFPKLFCFPNYPCYGNIMWYFWTPKVTCSSNKIPQYFNNCLSSCYCLCYKAFARLNSVFNIFWFSCSNFLSVTCMICITVCCFSRKLVSGNFFVLLFAKFLKRKFNFSFI